MVILVMPQQGSMRQGVPRFHSKLHCPDRIRTVRWGKLLDERMDERRSAQAICTSIKHSILKHAASFTQRGSLKHFEAQKLSREPIKTLERQAPSHERITT